MKILELDLLQNGKGEEGLAVAFGTAELQFRKVYQALMKGGKCDRLSSTINKT